MESLSPKQVREIKDLYKNVYKEEVVEEVGDFDDLFESEEFQSLSDELKENIIKKMQDSMAKSEKSGVLGQLERLRRKAFGSEKERTQAINFEKNKNIIDKQKRNIPPEERNTMNITPVNSKPKDTVPVAIGSISPEGKKQASINKMEFQKNKEIEALKKENEKEIEALKKENEKNNEIEKKAEIEVKPEPKISPATFKTNQRQSRELVSTGKLKDTDLNKYSRSNTYTADDGKTQVNRSTVNTIAKFDMGPNIKKGEKLGVISGNLRKRYDMKASSFKEEAYDIVLDYVLTEGHADTVEEAHYVMMQMDEDTIKTIIKENPILKTALVGLGGYMGYKGLKKAGDSFNNMLNNLRNNSKLGGNKRVDDVRKNSGDPNVGQKYNFGNQGNKP